MRALIPSWRELLALAGVALASRAGAALPAPGSVAEVRIPAPALGQAGRSVFVYLPPSYDRPAAASRRYPVVYLLHGGPGRNSDWPVKGHLAATVNRLTARRRIPEVIVVMPDATGPARLGRSLFLNGFDGRHRTEDFLVRDVPAWVDRTLRSRPVPSARVLIGNSEGGWAAVNLCFKHPDVFGACGGLSGEYRLRPGRGDQAVLGPLSRAGHVIEENSPLLYVPRIAPRLRGLKIYVDCGVLDLPLLDTVRMDRALTARGVPHGFRLYLGSHDWGSWRGALEHALVALLR